MASSALSADAIALDVSLYPETCLLAAQAAYEPYAEVLIEPRQGHQLIVHIRSKTADKSTTIRREFLNYVLDLSLRHHLAGG